VLSAWLLFGAACSSDAEKADPGATPPLGPPSPGGTVPGEVAAGDTAPPVPGTNEGVNPDLPLAQPGVEAGPVATRFISDACALAGEQNGWGPIERDLSNGEELAGDGGPISIGDVVHGKGLGVHAPSDVSFGLAGRCSRFGALVGIDDEMKAAGSVNFQVYGDGALLAESGTLTGADAAHALDVDVTGVSELRLVVDAGGGTGSDHADWAEAALTCSGSFEPCAPARLPVPEYPGYRLAWADEFDVDGAPNPANWSFENGFVRNEEAQWYQADNASVRAGFLVIEGRRERVPNPNYRAGSGDWKTNRQFAEYTSSSLHSRGKQSFRFGRLEMRGRFPAYQGLWPAWWTLGNDGEWPWNGEVDILEFYAGSLHANFVVGTNTQWEGNWDAIATPLSALGGADWDAGFHVYRMEWDETTIVLSVDGRELNSMNVAALRNPDGQSPFVNPAYTLLNLAIGGQAGGNPAAVPFPVRYEVDYVRVYQKE
jgi:beta-glucanase (GH16 family)